METVGQKQQANGALYYGGDLPRHTPRRSGLFTSGTHVRRLGGGTQLEERPGNPNIESQGSCMDIWLEIHIWPYILVDRNVNRFSKFQKVRKSGIKVQEGMSDLRQEISSGGQNETRFNSGTTRPTTRESSRSMCGERGSGKPRSDISLEWLCSLPTPFCGAPEKVDKEQIDVRRSLAEWSETFQVFLVKVSHCIV